MCFKWTQLNREIYRNAINQNASRAVKFQREVFESQLLLAHKLIVKENKLDFMVVWFKQEQVAQQNPPLTPSEKTYLKPCIPFSTKPTHKHKQQRDLSSRRRTHTILGTKAHHHLPPGSSSSCRLFAARFPSIHGTNRLRSSSHARFRYYVNSERLSCTSRFNTPPQQ